MTLIVKKTRNRHSIKSKNNKKHNFKQSSSYRSRHRKRSSIKGRRVMKRKTRRNLRGGDDDPVSYEEGNKYNFMLQAKKIQYKLWTKQNKTYYVLSDILTDTYPDNQFITIKDKAFAYPPQLDGDRYNANDKQLSKWTSTLYIKLIFINIKNNGQYTIYFNNGKKYMFKIYNIISGLYIETMSPDALLYYKLDYSSCINIDNEILDFTEKPFKIVMFKTDRLFAVNKKGSSDDHLLYLDKIITNEDNITIHIIIFYPRSFTEKKGSINILISNIKTYFITATKKEWFSINMEDVENKDNGNTRQFQFVSEGVMGLFIDKIEEIKEIEEIEEMKNFIIS